MFGGEKSERGGGSGGDDAAEAFGPKVDVIVVENVDDAAAVDRARERVVELTKNIRRRYGA